MLKAHFARLDCWPGPRTESRKYGTFRANWLNTLDLLEYELLHQFPLGGRYAVLAPCCTSVNSVPST